MLLCMADEQLGLPAGPGRSLSSWGQVVSGLDAQSLDAPAMLMPPAVVLSAKYPLEFQV